MKDADWSAARNSMKRVFEWVSKRVFEGVQKRVFDVV